MAIVFVTGTDTGIGKTVLTALLTAHLRRSGRDAVALKPASSGGRADARALRRAGDAALTLEEVNPWHFRAALAPPLAAAREGRRLRLAEVTRHVRAIATRHEIVLVEGAGGWLSPLTGDGDNRDALRALRARPLVVVPDRLGAINQALLVHAALAPRERRAALWVLVAPHRERMVHRLNRAFLRARLGSRRVFLLPFLDRRAGTPGAAQRTLVALARALVSHPSR
jgi:dethiobiotin synthetase